MNITKKLSIDSLINVSLQKLGELSVGIAEASMGKCSGLALYETKFPQELLKLEEEE